MKDFAELGRQHDQYRADYPATPKLNERASFLMDQMTGLGRVKPSLESRYLVKGWMDRGAFSVVYGDSNVGKTFFALDLAVHVAAGRDWQGNRVATGDKWAGWVLYCALEGGKGIHNRIEAMRLRQPALMASVADDQFSLLCTQMDFCAPGDASALIEALEAGSGTYPSLIVIDTLARAMGAGDENSSKDMGALTDNLDLIRQETGAHVMVVHHSGKDASKGARGSSALRAAADTEIHITKANGTIQAQAEKQRDMACDALFAYTLETVEIGADEDGDPVTSAVVVEAEPSARKVRLSGKPLIAKQALDDALAHHGEVKFGDLFPQNRRCVHLDKWREFCDRHSLSNGESDSASRTAFMRAKSKLQDLELVRIVDDFAWRVEE